MGYKNVSGELVVSHPEYHEIIQVLTLIISCEYIICFHFKLEIAIVEYLGEKKSHNRTLLILIFLRASI